MIPRYPAFRPLELSDHTEVLALTVRHPPYSDFNFASLYSWNTKGATQISTLHGNLVVRMADYMTGVPFYTFLGEGSVNETAEELTRRSNEEGYGASLRLVPESVAHRLDRARLSYDMDMDSNDYVLSTGRLRNFKGTELQKKRNWVNRFMREHPGHRVAPLELGTRAVNDALLRCFEAWAAQKDIPGTYDLIEYKAFHRLLSAADFIPELHGLGVYIHDRLVAFMVLELVQHQYGMGHFSKADAEFSGLTPFLMREIGEFLAQRGYEHLNYQQDLGLEGLRHSKKSYIPAAYLRKYRVAVRTAAASRRPSRPSFLSIPAVSDAFLASGGLPDLFGDAVSLRPPSVSNDLLDLAREEESRERSTIRQSRIITKPVSDEEAAEESHSDSPDRHSSTG